MTAYRKFGFACEFDMLQDRRTWARKKTGNHTKLKAPFINEASDMPGAGLALKVGVTWRICNIHGTILNNLSNHVGVLGTP